MSSLGASVDPNADAMIFFVERFLPCIERRMHQIDTAIVHQQDRGDVARVREAALHWWRVTGPGVRGPGA